MLRHASAAIILSVLFSGDADATLSGQWWPAMVSVDVDGSCDAMSKCDLSFEAHAESPGGRLRGLCAAEKQQDSDDPSWGWGDCQKLSQGESLRLTFYDHDMTAKREMGTVWITTCGSYSNRISIGTVHAWVAGCN